MRISRGTTSSRSFCASAAVVLALAAGAAGCGGDDDEAAAVCEAQARKAAEARVVADYFDAGRLGTRTEVQQELDHPRLTFFAGSGELLAYERMTPAAQAVFNRWVANTRVGDLTLEARQQAREDADPDC